MRTTIDIRDELMHELQLKAVQEKKTLKELVNSLLTIALGKAFSSKKKRWECISYNLGGKAFQFEQAWEVVDQLEGEALANKLELRK